MARYRVFLTTVASTHVDVETDLTDPDEIVNEMWENGFDTPTLCHQCEGGRRSGNPPLDLNDEWDVDTLKGKVLVEKIDE